MCSLKINEFFSRFFWDAHFCNENRSPVELSVSLEYIEHWEDIEELWFLGMQVFSSLLVPVSAF